MHIIDISWPLSNTITEYKDRKQCSITPYKTIAEQGTNELTLTCINHTGTHIDAPYHCIKSGNTIDQIPLSTYIGQCRVIDLTHVHNAIQPTDLEPYNLQKDEIILCKTVNSNHAPTDLFDYQFVYLSAGAAQLCADKNIRCIGIDYLGIERNQPGHPTHKTLLEKNIGIIEGLRLAAVTPGNYFLCCLPLLIQSADGAPARAILLDTKI